MTEWVRYWERKRKRPGRERKRPGREKKRYGRERKRPGRERKRGNKWREEKGEEEVRREGGGEGRESEKYWGNEKERGRKREREGVRGDQREGGWEERVGERRGWMKGESGWYNGVNHKEYEEGRLKAFIGSRDNLLPITCEHAAEQVRAVIVVWIEGSGHRPERQVMQCPAQQ